MMTRKQVKYLLARLRSEAERGVPPPDLPDGFRESFESQEAFRGWVNFHVTWDVSEDDVWKVVPLAKSAEEQWHDRLRAVVPLLPISREGVASIQPDHDLPDKLDG